jgi:GNAT acetyltransferase-like protein
MSDGSDLQLGEYRDRDEAEVLTLLTTSLGSGPAGSRPPEFFRWKHFDNPFGRSLMLVAQVDGRVVGLRAFMRWRFRAGRNLIRAARAVDTATHPAFRRLGIFSKSTLESVDRLRADTDLIFNTPNDRSRPGYLKMGWEAVTSLPILLGVRQPVQFAVRKRWGTRSGVRPSVEASPAVDGLADPRILQLIDETQDTPRISTDRTLEYLRWRYCKAPLLDYRILLHESGERLAGAAIFRLRPRGASSWGAAVTELLVPSGDRRSAARLLRSVERAAPVDHVTCLFPKRSGPAQAARRRGYLRVEGDALVVNPLRDLCLDPKQFESWSLSLGDVEVF